jgi:hypothetical protein
MPRAPWRPIHQPRVRACSRMHTGSLTCAPLRTARAQVREPAHACVCASQRCARARTFDRTASARARALRQGERWVPHTLACARGDDRIFLRGGEIAHLRRGMRCDAMRCDAMRCGVRRCGAGLRRKAHNSHNATQRRSMQHAKRSTRVRRTRAGAITDAKMHARAHARAPAHACYDRNGMRRRPYGLDTVVPRSEGGRKHGY